MERATDQEWVSDTVSLRWALLRITRETLGVPRLRRLLRPTSARTWGIAVTGVGRSWGVWGVSCDLVFFLCSVACHCVCRRADFTLAS